MQKYILFFFLLIINSMFFGLEESQENTKQSESDSNKEYKNFKQQALINSYLTQIDDDGFRYFKSGKPLKNNIDFLIALSPVPQAKDLWIKRINLRKAGFTFFWLSMLSGATTIGLFSAGFSNAWLYFGALGSFFSGVITIIPMIIFLAISGTVRKQAIYLYNSNIKRIMETTSFNISPKINLKENVKDSFGVNIDLSFKLL